LIQADPHRVWPAGQEQAEATQLWAAGQTLPQRPQLRRSLVASVQTPLQGT
jgi:hypothetical protein